MEANIAVLEELHQPGPASINQTADPMLAEQLDGEAGDAFGSYSVSLQGSQETESETHLWEPGSCHIFIPIGMAWG